MLLFLIFLAPNIVALYSDDLLNQENFVTDCRATKNGLILGSSCFYWNVSTASFYRANISTALALEPAGRYSMVNIICDISEITYLFTTTRAISTSLIKDCYN